MAIAVPALPQATAASAMLPLAPSTFGSPLEFQSRQTSLLQVATGYSIALGSLSGSLTPPTVTPQFPTIATAPVPVTANLPVLKDVNWLVPVDPGGFQGTLNTSDLVIPPFNIQPPVLSFGTAPVATFGSAPDAPPVETQFDFPTLTLELPTAPQL